MRIEALGPRARVEMKLAALEPPRLGQQPLEERSTVALAPSVGAGAEVVDVQVATPREAVSHAEPGDGHRLLLLRHERADQPVTGRTKHAIHVLGEPASVLLRGAQSSHRSV